MTTQLEALFQAKQGEINDLHHQLKQEMMDMKEEQEKIEELELYMKMQEEHYAEHMAKLGME